MDNSQKELGLRIKKIRKQHKINQTQLANKLNKTLRTVQKYESGEIEPSIAIINEIAKIFNISPAEIMGYEHEGLHLNSLSDILFVLNELNKKSEIHFDIDIKRPPNNDEWTCSITFNGNNKKADNNADLCMFLERYADERFRLETYWTSQDYFNHWFEQELAYYSNCILHNKPVEIISDEERIKRRNELDRQMLLAKRKEKEQSE